MLGYILASTSSTGKDIAVLGGTVLLDAGEELGSRGRGRGGSGGGGSGSATGGGIP